MPIAFTALEIGQAYERPFLADLWGYKGFQAISRGVITPAGDKVIVLFVTKDNQEALTQYNNYIDGTVLHWEGEAKHAADLRIVNASANQDAIHLFYREVHHSPFVYYGEIVLTAHTLLSDRPSQFIFALKQSTPAGDLLDDLAAHQHEYAMLDSTEQEAIIKSRIGQGIFRDRLIQAWGGCSVTGLSHLALLRASHIKPWRHSSNSERLDPLNGLLLHPALDHLFDGGLIGFADNGQILLSKRLSQNDLEILHVHAELRLREVPEGLKKYLRFHREHVFRAD